MSEPRSEFLARRLYHWRLGQDVGAARGPYTAERNAQCDALAAEAAGVTWAPEPTADRAAGAREEREAVVRWLREQIAANEGNSTFLRYAGDLVNSIEAGEHRKEASSA